MAFGEMPNIGIKFRNDADLITYTPNYTINQSWLVKIGNVVIGKLNFFNANNNTTYTGGTVIGSMPYKPKISVSILLELAGGGGAGLVTGGATIDINTSGNIIPTSSITNGRYFSSATFIYFTDD